MDRRLNQDSPSPARPWLMPYRQQLSAGAITMACLVLIAWQQTFSLWKQGRQINVDRPFVAKEVDLRIDLNEADWPELTLLPEISETMARRIVDYRELHGAFQSNEEVKNVHGIGPRTFSLMEPYLAPMNVLDVTVGNLVEHPE